jgi:hypothetical protein
MMKIGFAVAAAAAVLMTAPSLVSTTPAKAQTLEMAQGVDVQLGRNRRRRGGRGGSGYAGKLTKGRGTRSRRW